MRLIGNLIWLVFGGFFMALSWWLAGVLYCITVIGIPFGIAAFRIGTFTLWPFGREVVDSPDSGGLRMLGNILWFVVCGWWLAIGHLVSAVLCALTIIGIPFAFQHIKLAGLSLLPFGKTIVVRT